MIGRGTCLYTYLALRKQESPASEMVSCLIFGESYTILEESRNWLKIKTDFDSYEGYISIGSHSPFQEFSKISESLYSIYSYKSHQVLIPCGGLMPESGVFILNGNEYHETRVLKKTYHLPPRQRLLNVANAFLNTPYLWGGRTFMGIDCSGFVQVVFKSLGIHIPRDTSQQIHFGKEISPSEVSETDIVFFADSKDALKPTHIGIMISKSEVIHAGPSVRVNQIENGLMQVTEKSEYQVIQYRRFL